MCGLCTVFLEVKKGLDKEKCKLESSHKQHQLSFVVGRGKCTSLYSRVDVCKLVVHSWAVSELLLNDFFSLPAYNIDGYAGFEIFSKRYYASLNYFPFS